MLKISKLYLLICVISGTTAVLIGGTFPYLLFYSFVGMLILAFINLAITKSCFNIEVDFKRDYYSTGDTGECITKINLNLLFPIPYLKIRSEAMKYSGNTYDSQIINLTADENKWIRSNIIFRKRGIYNLGRVDAYVTDIFNILTYIKKFDKDINIKVYPRIYNLRNLERGGSDIFLEKSDKNSTNEEQWLVKDVRKYRMGDSLKKIHWKISAKMNELYVKNTETISGEQYVVLVDMNKKNYDFPNMFIEEEIIEFTASMLNHLYKKEIDVDVYFNKKIMHMISIQCKQDFDAFMDFIVQQKSDGDVEITEFVHQLIYRFHRSHKIVLVVAALDDSLTENVLALKNSGYDLTVYYSTDKEETLRNRRKLETMLVECRTMKEMI